MAPVKNAYSSNSILILGCGYLGKRVARRMLALGWTVHALTRSPQRAAALERIGIQASIGDWTRAATLASLPQCERTLVAVGWDRRGDSQASRYDVYVRGLSNALPRLRPDTNLVYVSTTGVYHQSDGQWVDESSPCRPTIGSGGWAHQLAEQQLQRPRVTAEITILRLAGLYGPDRVPHQFSIRRGEPIPTPTAGYLNLIHVDDAADAVIQAWNTASPQRRIYAVSDGSPVRRVEYLCQIARLLGKPLVQCDHEQAPATARGRTLSNKRIWTRRFRRDLCPKLIYPSFREGLRAVLS